MLELAERLLERGHRVHGLVPRAGGAWLAARFTDLGIECDEFALKRSLDPGCARAIAGVLREREIDVLHSHDFTLVFYGAMASWLAGVRHVATMHGTLNVLEALRRRLALRAAFALSHAAVAVSGRTAVDFEQALSLGEGRMRVVYNGIPVVAAGTQERPGDEGPVLLAVGNLRAVKGHVHLVEAASLLEKRHPDQPWRIDIAGEGEERAGLEAMIRRLGLESRVRLLGFRSDIAGMLGAATAFVMPSESEGLPLALLEAMSLGVPIVASAVGGIPEAIGRLPKAGLLVPPKDPEALADALLEVCANTELRETMSGVAARRFQERFSSERMVEQYVSLYLGASPQGVGLSGAQARQDAT